MTGGSKAPRIVTINAGMAVDLDDGHLCRESLREIKVCAGNLVIQKASFIAV